MKNILIRSAAFFYFLLMAPTALAQLPAQNIKLTADHLKFSYQSFDGETFHKCRHTIQDVLAQDWHVECFDNNGKVQRTYIVHLWLSAYAKAQVPRLSYELLYWVTDRSRGTSLSGHSTTVWFHLKDPSSLDSLSVSQGVDADTAGLYLNIQLPN